MSVTLAMQIVSNSQFSLSLSLSSQLSVNLSLLEGTNQGVRSLLVDGLTVTKEMLREAQLAYPRTPVSHGPPLKSQDRYNTCACALSRI